MSRSGSESSLFGSLKGLISKPLAWLATPRSSKRDQSTWAAGVDSEDPESPSVKKLRKDSPPRQRGAYDPPSVSRNGKGKQREMLPPLPDLAGGLKKLPTSKAMATLPHSQSMPYLDPPSGLLSPPKKSGAITRSRGMNLASMANDEEEAPVVQEKDTWSPWRQQTSQSGRSRTPAKQSNRGSISEARDVGVIMVIRSDPTDPQFTLPSLSPFRAPPSPSVARGLSRSATANNLRRGESIASDISMGRQSNTARQVKGSSSMLFGTASVARDAEDGMSIDGADRTRDRSVSVSCDQAGRWLMEAGLVYA
jgi:nucleoporin NUP1